MATIKTIGIIGCGLIGGSFCRALRIRHPEWKFICFDLTKNLASIEESQVANEVADMDAISMVLPICDLVFIATPVDVLINLFSEIAPHLKAGAIVMDAGSTKAAIMSTAKLALPENVWFVGGHPIAGAEHSGVESSDPLLFNERAFILCPDENTPPEILLLLIEVVEDLHAQPITMEAEEHDRILAMVSHVPQLLSLALMHAAIRDDAAHGILELIIGQGFLDTTRIASSEFKTWKGILQTNKDDILSALGRFENSINRIRTAIEQDEIEDLWQQISNKRRQIHSDFVPMMRLNELRQFIDRQDKKILELLGKRFTAARKIGRIKQKHGQPIFDENRETTLMKNRKELGILYNLTSDFIEDMFRAILDHAKRAQK